MTDGVVVVPGTVEAVAKALYEAPLEWEGEEFVRWWDKASQNVKEQWFIKARIAIGAYLKHTGESA